MRSRKSNIGSRPAWARYGGAFCAVALSLLVRWLLDPLLGYNHLFLTLYGGVALTAWLCRWRPAAVAAVAGFLASDYLFVPPRHSLAFSPVFIVDVVGYFLSSALIIFGGEWMHRARDRAERDAAERKRAAEELLESRRRIEADLIAMTHLQQVGNSCLVPENQFDKCLNEILAAAIAITQADKGHIQLLDGKSGALKIAAQSGFAEPYSKFFASVSPGHRSASGTAMTGARVLVEDVMQSKLFDGPSLNVLLDAGVRAVQSTPLTSSRGSLLGMISTHFHQPHRMAEQELRLLDLLARQAADYVERRQVEEVLSAKERKLETIIGSTPFMLTLCSRDWRFQFVSRAYAAMLGRKPEDIVGKPIIEIVGEEGFKIIQPEVEKVLAGNRVEYESDIYFRGVGTRSLHVVYTPEADEQGNVIGWIASMVDVTERKCAEKAQAQFIHMLDSGFDAIIVRDAQDRITGWNHGAERLYDWTREEALGQVTHELFKTGFPKPLKDILADVLRDNRWEGELVHTRKGGAVINVFSRWTLERDANGNPATILETNMDITSRKQAEEKLRINSDRARLLVSVIADVPWTADVQGVFVEPQPAWEKYAGQKWEDYRGACWCNAMHPGDQLIAQVTWRRACADGNAYELQGRLWHAPTQQHRHVLIRAVPLRNADGAVREWVGTCLDVHEKKMAVDALREAQRKLVRYVADFERKGAGA